MSPRKQFGVQKPVTSAGSTQDTESGADEESLLASRKSWPRDIPIDRVRPNPKQAREIFDQEALQELANGMIEHGFRGRLPVREQQNEQNLYELVYGERRWRAARLAGITMIPCDIGDYSDNDMEEIGLLENVQREDLTNYELGKKFAHLLTLKNEEDKPKYSVRTLAKRIGKDKSYIEDRLQYASAPVDVQQLAINVPDVPPRTIRELAHVDAPEDRAAIIQAVEDGKLGFRDVRDLRKQIQQDAEGSTTSTKATKSDTIQPSSKAARLVALRRLQREAALLQSILDYWKTETLHLTDEEVQASLLASIEAWETTLREIKQTVRP